MKDWKDYLIFLILLTALIVYSMYYYNEFVIAQGIIILIFLFSQFIQLRMFRENTELLRKQFKQESYQRERFSIISKIDKDIISLYTSINQVSFVLNSPNPEEIDEMINMISNSLYTVKQFAISNHLFFKPNEYLIIDKILNEIHMFCANETNKSIYETMGSIAELQKEFTKEFQKSLEL